MKLCEECQARQIKERDKQIRQTIFWAIEMGMDDVDPTSREAIALIDRYRPPWNSQEEFIRVYHDEDAMRDWMKERAR